MSNKVAAVASHYGDPDGKYSAWLAGKDPLYPGEAFFFWDQPLSDSGLKVTEAQILSNGTSTTPDSPASTTHKSGAIDNTVHEFTVATAIAAFLVAIAS